MDGQPTPKKSKVDGIEDNGSSLQQPDGASGGEDRVEGAVIENPNRDYFTPALMDIWPKILDFVREPKDVVSVLNTSAVFRSLLEKRKAAALLPLVLPILMKQDPRLLPQRVLFNCRLVGKQMKASVDDILINQRHWLVREPSYSLHDPDYMQDFLDVTPGINGNPFLARLCYLNLGEDLYHNSIEVLKRHGHELNHVFLQIEMDYSPERTMKIVKGALCHLPDLQSLELEFFMIEVGNEDKWKIFRPDDHYLPALKSLEKLELTCFVYEDVDDLVQPPPSFLRQILLVYGYQLTSLSCESFVFKGETWKSVTFPHLLHLEASFHVAFHESSMELQNIYRNLAKLHCPQLESLTFNGYRMELTAETILAVNSFRSTLKKLRFARYLEENQQLFQMDPSDVREFPQLTQLTLYGEDAETPCRHLFRTMFTKLRELTFQLVNAAERIPTKSVRMGYFTIFPDLRRITCIRKEYLGGPPVCTETVFERQNYV